MGMCELKSPFLQESRKGCSTDNWGTWPIIVLKIIIIIILCV